MKKNKKKQTRNGGTHAYHGQPMIFLEEAFPLEHARDVLRTLIPEIFAKYVSFGPFRACRINAHILQVSIFSNRIFTAANIIFSRSISIPSSLFFFVSLHPNIFSYLFLHPMVSLGWLFPFGISQVEEEGRTLKCVPSLCTGGCFSLRYYSITDTMKGVDR
ncbi:hypothetical protein CDAR_484931 [Caerostris darwini]|uniref:Uncharacterized protein n=1 Tax=Caerostris darwini TaxID=1538125 RepID=A0AAV4PEH4_9ARAC|nr:hypothetical protein CDAR_484931 [Caerostris darwini]